MAPARAARSPEARTTKGYFMAITKDSASAHPSTRENEERTAARLRMVLVLKEAEERYRHELMDEEERLMLHERINRLKKKLAASAS